MVKKNALALSRHRQFFAEVSQRGAITETSRVSGGNVHEIRKKRQLCVFCVLRFVFYASDRRRR